MEKVKANKTHKVKLCRKALNGRYQEIAGDFQKTNHFVPSIYIHDQFSETIPADLQGGQGTKLNT